MLTEMQIPEPDSSSRESELLGTESTKLPFSIRLIWGSLSPINFEGHFSKQQGTYLDNEMLGIVFHLKKALTIHIFPVRSVFESQNVLETLGYIHTCLYCLLEVG